MKMIYVYRDGQQYGPYTDQQLLDFIASGNVSRDDHARREDWTEWKTVNDVLPATNVPLPSSTPTPPSLPINQPGIPTSQNRSSAKVAFILSLLSATICLWFLSIPAIIMGHRALSRANDAKDRTRAIRSLAIGYPVLLIGLILIAISSANPQPSPANASSSPGNTTTASAAAGTPTTDQPTASGPKIGDTVTVEHISIQVTKIETKDWIGADGLKSHANPGATYLIVYYNITNRGKETQVNWSDDDFKLEDSQDRSYSPSSDATTALMSIDPRKDLLLSDLQPDVTKSTSTAFEIPKDSAHGLLTFVISQGGGFLWLHSKRIILQ